MAIGSPYHVISRNKVSSLVVRFLGTSDLHSHFRTKPLIEWAKRAQFKRQVTIVEVGCGTGNNILELVKILPDDVQFIGFDLSESSIQTAIDVSRENGIQNVKFFCDDCARFKFALKAAVVLLMDFLEHISDPVAFLRDVRALVEDDAVLVISVPTPRYPKVFGRKFHTEVGHLVDGYNDDDLRKILREAGFEISEYKYNTGFLASIFCYIYYNALCRIKKKNKAVVGVVLSTFRFLDVFNGPKVSCSLFAIARPLCKKSSSHAH